MSRYLIRLRPRSDSFYVSKNRTVLATDLHGEVGSSPKVDYLCIRRECFRVTDTSSMASHHIRWRSRTCIKTPGWVITLRRLPALILIRVPTLAQGG